MCLLVGSCHSESESTSTIEASGKELADQLSLIQQLPADTSFVATWRQSDAQEGLVSLGASAPEAMEAWTKIGSAWLQTASEQWVLQHAREFLSGQTTGQEVEGTSLAFLHFLSSREGQHRMKGLKIPPIIGALRLPDEIERARHRDEIKSWLQSFARQPGGLATVESFPAARTVFHGVRFHGLPALHALSGFDGATLDEKLGKKRSQRLRESFRSQELFALIGEVDDYLIVFLGSELEGLQLAASKDKSLLAHPEFQFARDLENKELKGLVYAGKDLLQVLAKNFEPLESLSKGVRLALNATSAFPESHRLERALDKLADREARWIERYAIQAMIGVAYTEGSEVGFELKGGPEPAFLSPLRKRSLKIPRDPKTESTFVHGVFEPETTWHLASLLTSIGECLYLSGELSPRLSWSSWSHKLSALENLPSLPQFEKDAQQLLGVFHSDLALILHKESAKNTPGTFLSKITQAATVQEKGPACLRAIISVLGTLGKDSSLPDLSKSPKVSEQEGFLTWSLDTQVARSVAALSSDLVILSTDENRASTYLQEVAPHNAPSPLLEASFTLPSTFFKRWNAAIPIADFPSALRRVDLQINFRENTYHWKGKLKTLTRLQP